MRRNVLQRRSQRSRHGGPARLPRTKRTKHGSRKRGLRRKQTAEMKHNARPRCFQRSRRGGPTRLQRISLGKLRARPPLVVMAHMSLLGNLEGRGVSPCRCRGSSPRQLSRLATARTPVCLQARSPRPRRATPPAQILNPRLPWTVLRSTTLVHQLPWTQPRCWPPPSPWRRPPSARSASTSSRRLQLDRSLTTPRKLPR
mmetsp:Transcript_71955/g.192155  ORF Transcript_71955/g.192155 Transcript_71955/m.192155 type:complete len:200 (+) Transcript_71955:695-1294(+)